MKTSILKHTRTASTVIIVILFSISLWQLAEAGWIQCKAIIAQQLLDYSWQQTLDEKESDNKTSTFKPWPWSDTWPAAKLLVPQHGIEQIILAGDSGSSLAFAPGYSLAGAVPNMPGTTIITAHRDTHFRFLRDLKIGDAIYLQTTDRTVRYQVYDFQVVDSKSYTVLPSHHEQTLVLATCYPFDAMTSGGALRYLVFANRKPV